SVVFLECADRCCCAVTTGTEHRLAAVKITAATSSGAVRSRSKFIVTPGCQVSSLHLDCVEVCSVAVSCQGDRKPHCIAFAVPSREVREGCSCRDMLNVLNFVVGTFVKVCISAGR